MKIDKFHIIGFLIAFLLPFLCFYGYYEYEFFFWKWTAFLKNAYDSHLIAPILSLCVVPNLALFFIFYQMDNLSGIRGVVFATFIHAAIIAYFKFLT